MVSSVVMFMKNVEFIYFTLFYSKYMIIFELNYLIVIDFSIKMIKNGNYIILIGPISGNNEESCLNIPNSQHVFKPIISPRPSILRKRDADG